MLFLYRVSLPGLPAIALWVQNQIPGVKNLYPWAFPLIVFIGVLLVFAVWGLVRVRHRLLVLETPVLKVSDYSSKNDRGHSWISLFVENPTDIPIPDCQGEVREWRIIQPTQRRPCQHSRQLIRGHLARVTKNPITHARLGHMGTIY